MNSTRKAIIGSILLLAITAMIFSVIIRCTKTHKDSKYVQIQCKQRTLSVFDRKLPYVIHYKIASVNNAGIESSKTDLEGIKKLAVNKEECVFGLTPAELASEKNRVMDKLLNQPQIPSDYADVMIELYRDKSHDVLTRDFAVQHIGLYAQALARRGGYDADASESRKLRAALFDAAGETRTIVAAAAFRALADMAVFDPRVDTNRLDSLLAACTADASSDPASRSVAVQLCGERRVRSSRPALAAIGGDSASPAVLRISARRALAVIDGKELAQ